MASTLAENWEHMDGHDGSENSELSLQNHNLLMSLLDETQIDDCDDEQLRNVIQSLEAEIDFTDHFTLDNTVWESDLVDHQPMISESCRKDPSTVHVDLDHWMDVEIMPTSPSGDMDSWYMDHDEQEIMDGAVTEFGWVKNCSPLEADQDYGSLRHETNGTHLIE